MKINRRTKLRCAFTFAMLLATGCNYTKDRGQILESSTSLVGPLSEGPSLNFTCANPAAQSQTLSYPLSRVQYINTITDLFGTTVVGGLTSQLSALPNDSFDPITYSRVSGVSSDSISGYFFTAKAIAAAVIANKTSVINIFGSCAWATPPPSTCINTYINGFAKQILRRPLTAAEVSYAQSIANRGGTWLNNLATLLTIHLTSPSFLWRLELGTDMTGATNPVQLTPYEVAARLSYLATDSTPDATLMAAADANQLSTQAQILAQVQRLLQTAHGKVKVRSSLLHWARADQVNDISTLPAELTQGITISGLTQAMEDEAAAYTDYSLANNASFQTYLTSNLSLAANTSLATIYGHAPVTDMTKPATFTGRRQGILMRGPTLSWMDPRTGIIIRGVNFQKYILCNEIPMPSAALLANRDAAAYSPDEMLVHTNREAITHQTDNPLCMGCHGTINPTGYAFENFDALGRLRTQEQIFDVDDDYVRNLPVSTVASVPMPDGNTVNVQDGYDLVSYVATSEIGQTCFTRNMFRYFYEKQETAADGCQLTSTMQKVSDPKQTILSAITNMLTAQVLFKKQN